MRLAQRWDGNATGLPIHFDKPDAFQPATFARQRKGGGIEVFESVIGIHTEKGKPGYDIRSLRYGARVPSVEVQRQMRALQSQVKTLSPEALEKMRFWESVKH